MTVVSGKTQTKRNQVSLRKEEYELAKKLAAEKGTTMSRVIGEALRAVDTENSQTDPLAHLIGKFESADPDASEHIDEVVYGTGIR